jgi:hypothetical protein
VRFEGVELLMQNRAGSVKVKESPLNAHTGDVHVTGIAVHDGCERNAAKPLLYLAFPSPYPPASGASSPR